MVGETLGKDRAREAGFPCKPLQSPHLGWARMNEPQRLADVGITQAREPSAGLGREGFGVAADLYRDNLDGKAATVRMVILAVAAGVMIVAARR